jgi:hypothetical protein
VWRVVFVVLVAACGPRVDPDAASGSGEGSSTSTSSATASTTLAAETVASATGVDTSSGAPATTGAPASCEASTPNCADGCTIVSAHFATWDDPHVGGTEHVCVAEGPPVGEYRSTWWAMIDGELRIITSTPECLNDHPPQQLPVEWSECAGMDDEPAACRYLCAQDVCPGEVDVATLRSCAIEEPCGDAWFICGRTTDCLMAALRDRMPGRYAYNPGILNGDIEWVLVVEPDGGVRATYDETFGIGCATGLWQPARRCRLADPQLFDACMTTGRCPAACEPNPYTLDPWLVDCVDEPAICV